MAKQVIVKETKVVSTETAAVLLDGTEAEEFIQQFNEAKRVIKLMEEQKKAAEAKLRELMGDATVGLIAGVNRVNIKHHSRESINTADLKEVFPEAYELCRRDTPYTVMTVVS